MNLYWIEQGLRTSDDSSEACDLFVIAASPADAGEMWSAHYGFGKVWRPDRIHTIPLPVEGPARVIDWEAIACAAVCQPQSPLAK